MKLPRIPYLYLLALPWLLVFFGALSNQLVLAANQAVFPVLLNPRQVAKMQKNETDIEQIIGMIPGANDAKFSVMDSSLNADTATVSDDGMTDTVHRVMRSTDKLKFLADWINTGDAVYSPGDELIQLGAFLWGYAPTVWCVLTICLIKERFAN